jgi:hypothetical protein
VHLADVVGANTKGTWSFDTLADFVNNRARSVTQAVSTASSDPKQNLMALFFQDDFKLSPDLTLNLGLRYEYNSVPFGFFGATDPQIRAAGVPGPAGDDRNNWGPRLGLAYSPRASGGLARTLFGDGQTVFRGGYGISYDVFYFNLLSNAAGNQPRVVNDTRQRRTPTIYPTLPRATVTTSITFNPLANFLQFSYNNPQNPTTHFYSFSIQRECCGNQHFSKSAIWAIAAITRFAGELNMGRSPPRRRCWSPPPKNTAAIRLSSPASSIPHGDLASSMTRLRALTTTHDARSTSGSRMGCSSEPYTWRAADER